MERISVIIPVYKVEPYLDRCVRSVVEQTYRDLDIILVDDGSPDNCPAMCDAWAEKDCRVRVVHKPNGGLSDARNAGMAAATGELIAFVDSDDWIEPQMYERLYQLMQQTGSDVASGGVQRVWEDGRAPQQMTYCGEQLMMNRVQAMESLIDETALIVPVWNKLYRRQLVDHIPFAVGKINEDEFWSWRVVAQADRIAVTPEIFYNYLQRSGSIMSGQVMRHPMDAIEAKCERHEYIAAHMSQLESLSTLNLMYVCLFRAQVIRSGEVGSEEKKVLEQLHQTVKEHGLAPDARKHLPLKQRLRYDMIRHCFHFTAIMQNRLHIGI